MTAYGTIETGKKYTKSYRVYVTENEKVISPFHDIPLKNEDGTYNCVNEIARFECAKFEISKEEAFNPILQDVKKGEVRFVKNIFPTKGYQGYYGAFPQTYEDPAIVDEHCNAKGDNDPLDCVDISNVTKGTGAVYRAKPLGCLAMLDGGEADFKVLVIDAADEEFENINDIEDIEKVKPGLLNNLFKWFRDYKKPDGKGENSFAMEGKYQNAAFARKIIEEMAEKYNTFLKKGGDGKIALKSKKNGDVFETKDGYEGEAELPDSVNHFYYV